MKKHEKKPFYKRWWFILIVLSIVIGGPVSILQEDENKVISGPGEGESKITEEKSYELTFETELELNDENNKHLSVFGETDLPDGEELIISLVSEEHDYAATSNDEVKNGLFLSEPFTKNGESLLEGKYIVTVSTVETGKVEETKQIDLD